MMPQGVHKKTPFLTKNNCLRSHLSLILCNMGCVMGKEKRLSEGTKRFSSLLREGAITQLRNQMGFYPRGGLRGERQDPLAHLGVVALDLKPRIPKTPVCAR